jgi:excisionase family DNA binding protein
MKFDASASKDFATVPELAALWRCTEQHVYKLIRRGALPAFRIGARVIISRSAAQNFLEQGATAHTPEAA